MDVCDQWQIVTANNFDVNLSRKDLSLTCSKRIANDTRMIMLVLTVFLPLSLFSMNKGSTCSSKRNLSEMKVCREISLFFPRCRDSSSPFLRCKRVTRKTIGRMHVIKSVNKRTIQSFLVKWLDFIESMVYTAFTRRERVYDFFLVRLAFFLSAERKRFLHC